MLSPSTIENAPELVSKVVDAVTEVQSEITGEGSSKRRRNKACILALELLGLVLLRISHVCHSVCPAHWQH